MTDTPENLAPTLLRRLDEKVDRLIDEVRDVKDRQTSLERQIALVHGDFAGQSVRIDRIETRLERIERRLDLIPAR